MLGSALYKTLLTDHRLQSPRPVAGECLSHFINPLWGKRFMANKAIRSYSLINKGTWRGMLYYFWTSETSSKENSPAIGSFLWVVMLTMIMKPHLWSMREKNIDDLVWGKFPNYVVFSEPKCSLPSLPTNYILKMASFRLHPVWGTNPDDPEVTIT